MVTNKHQEEAHSSLPNYSFDSQTGTFKPKPKEFGIAMPTTSEGLGARLFVLGISYVFLKMKYPSKGILATADPMLFHHYTEWLFGPNNWGKSTMGADMKPRATPTLEHILVYDMAIREKMADLMNEGIDIETALDTAQADPEVRQKHFLENVSIDINTEKCRAITAPGLVDARSASSRSPALRDADNVSKTQLKKIKQQAKNEAEQNAKRKLAMLSNGPNDGPGGGLSTKARQRANKTLARQQLALQNGGVGDGGFPRLQGAGGAGGQIAKGVGKGKGKNTFEGKPICLNWNRKAPCKAGASCNMAHVCLKCYKNHPQTDCTEA